MITTVFFYSLKNKPKKNLHIIEPLQSKIFQDLSKNSLVTSTDQNLGGLQLFLSLT